MATETMQAKTKARFMCARNASCGSNTFWDIFRKSSWNTSPMLSSRSDRFITPVTTRTDRAAAGLPEK